MVKRTSITLATLILMSIVGCAPVTDRDFVVETVRQLRRVRIEVRSFKFDKKTNSLVFDSSGELIIGVKDYVEARSKTCTEAKTAMANMARTRDELVETISLLNRERLSVWAFDYEGKGTSLSFEKGKLTKSPCVILHHALIHYAARR